MTIRALTPPTTVGTIGADADAAGIAHAALAGNDSITGGAMFLGSGNDYFSLAGNPGSGAMTWGADGNDTMLGANAPGDDGGGWINFFYGGSGADSLVGGTGFDQLMGDCMDLALTLFRMIEIPFAPGADTLSGGGGADLLIGGEGADVMSGGAGADLFVWESAAELTSVDTITDFAAASDLLFFNHLIVPTGGTPNLAAYVALVPSGGNTMLRLDRDGSGGTYGMVDVALLEGSVASLDASRVIGFNPTPVLLGQTYAMVGSEWGDTVTRTFEAMLTAEMDAWYPMYLLGGDDQVTVEYGGTFYALGDGDDQLSYQASIDPELGDLADLMGGSGLQVDGGPGSDTLTGGNASDDLTGGSGADVIAGAGGNDLLYGDCSDLQLGFCPTENVTVTVPGADTLSGGDGLDVLIGGGGADLLSGGADSDLFVWDYASEIGAAVADTITDFQSGASGDRLFFGELIVPQPGDTAATSYVKLTASGPDTLIYLDRDGSGGAYGNQLVATLKNTVVASFASGQLPGLQGGGLQALEPSIASGAIRHVVGTYWADSVDQSGSGPFGWAEYYLLGGNDTVTTSSDDSWMLGDGDDRFSAKSGTTVPLSAYGDAGSDTLVGGDAEDMLVGGSGDDSLVGGTGSDDLIGDFTDSLLNFCADCDPSALPPVFVGGADTINGGAGTDLIVGGEGADDLTGGADSDLFVYEAASEFGDIIRDFQTGVNGDRIVLNGLITSTAGGNVSAYVALEQSGSDTLVRFSASGTGAASGTVVASLKNVSVGAIDLQNQILLGEELRVASPAPGNSAPVGSNAIISATEDTTKTGTLPAATDADSDPLTYAKVSNPSHGSATVSGDGSYSYTPSANYNGSDSFQFSVSDGTATVTYTANITVTAVDDAPTGTLTVNGVPTQGQTLTLTDTLTDADGLGARSYVWLANGSPIGSATGPTLLLDGTQLGKTISVRATYLDGGGKTETVTSSATSAVAASGGSDPGLPIDGGPGPDTLTGGAGADTISGFAGADLITGGAGNDRIDGGANLVTERDVARFSGPIADYLFSRTGLTTTVADTNGARDGTDTALDIERLLFTDMSVNLTVQATAASITQATLDRICELYVGFFGRVPAADGLENWIRQFNNGKSIFQIADDFYSIGSGPDLRNYTGYWDLTNNIELSNSDYVRIVYRNVLGREGKTGGINYWSGQLDTHAETRGSLVCKMLDSANTYEGDATWGWVADLVDDKVTMSKRVAIDWGLNYGFTNETLITKGMAIAGAVDQTGPTPGFPDIPVKVFDFADATAIVGVNPANIDLIA